MKIEIYTDGACSGNPGPGGWACILKCGDITKDFSGFVPDTTNNRMELLAVIRGLEQVKRPTEITIYSDSSYVVNAVNQNWLTNWQRNGWRTSGKQDVKNRDLWEELITLNTQHNPKYVWVKGHSTNELNNKCDFLAAEEIKKNR